ncbi:2-hydroxyisoflavanone dehydratase [Sesamum alatum]|uniref:2-hydroxyisoflavanone dehydratase n=1 Tax=Sesamum alatum TaxID=300844 RepID=A0AAE2CNT4_9LAMI|nr:2-hydroxyisoflavanone dehydratase [Sesamum alatum]
MAAPDNEIDYEFPSFLRLYKDGRVERLMGTESLPAGVDPQTGVTSKDVRDIVPGTEVYVRIYLPKLSSNTQKLPLLVYIHGGAFCVFTPSSALFHNYLNALVAESQVVAVSVHYRLAPEHPLPTAYEDSWAAVKWVASHRSGDGPEASLNQHADFRRVFLAGDSAGANIVHNLTMRAGSADAGLNLEILGIALVDPYFSGSDPVRSELLDPEAKAYGDRLWRLVCPSEPDHDDPAINPVAEGGPSLARLGCWRVLVSVAEKDMLRDRGRVYFEVLSRSGWMGMVEIHEVEGEGHCFHLFDLNTEKAKERMRRLAGFFNRDMPHPPILGQ